MTIYFNNHFKNRLLQISLLSIVYFVIISIGFKAMGQAGDVSQIRNGPANDPTKNFFSTFPNPDWVNGNAGSSNAHYREGYSIGYRSLITGAVVGRCYEYVLEYDTYHGAMAIDYLTHFQRLEPHAPFGHSAEVIAPKIFKSGSKEYVMGTVSENTGVIPPPAQSGITSGSTKNISGQPTASYNALPANEKLMTIYNGHDLTITYEHQDPIAISGNTNTATSVRVRFVADKDSVVLAWGGHIASRIDWGFSTTTGKALSAAGISGSPYHMRQISMNTCTGTNISLGNQDRSLSAAAVFPPPECPSVTSQTKCLESTSFTFTISNPDQNTTYTWSLGTNSVDAAISGSATGTSVTIIHNGGGSFTQGGSFTLNILANLNGVTQTCTGVATGTVIDVQVDAKDADNAFTLDLNTTGSQSLGIESISPGTTADYTYQWKLVSAPNGGNSSFTNLNSPNDGDATFNVLSPYALGVYTVRVIATQKAAPNCKDSSTVTIDVTGGVTCGIDGPATVCPGSQDNVYFYDPNGDHIADALPTGFTASWTFDGLHPSASFDGSTTGNSVKVDVAALASSCATSYTVKLTLTSSSTIVVQSCTKAVSVEDTEAPVITCPSDITLECSSTTNPNDLTVTGEATATDNCNYTINHSDETKFNCNVKVITRTWTATDLCGNSSSCRQLIIIKDTKAPVITCLSDGNITVADDCSSTSDIVTYYTEGGGKRHWTAIDASGNTATKDCDLPVLTFARQNTSSTQTINKTTVSGVKTQSKIAVKNVPASNNGIKVNAFPNPFSNEVNFRFSSTVAGKATLEIYNVLGQKVGDIYAGIIKAGQMYDVKYNLHGNKSSTLMYRLKVNDKSASGKLFKN